MSSWSALKKKSKAINRELFKSFLSHLIIEVGYPKSTLLQDYTQGFEKLLAHKIETIGIGIYPNDHLNVRQVAESLCTIVNRRRATDNSLPISCKEIAQEIGIIQSYGGIEQYFPVDETLLVTTPERVDQVIKALDNHHAVVLTAEPGAGKSWFIENLIKHLKGNSEVIKHYCYTALEDPLSLKRIKVNTLFGNLISQIIENDETLSRFKVKKYASNLDELNLLLGKIKKKTLIIVDGIDHIWRVYQKNRGGITEDETTIIKALAHLDFSNPNVSLLIVSQPIEQLSKLTPFYCCTLAPLSEEFVQELLNKHDIPNSEVDGVTLSHIIHKKSNGNALYCKYLIDHAIENKARTSFDWVNIFPPYQFNLTGYYKYIYEQIQGDSSVPCALCGADFSLTEEELKQVTHLGNTISLQLSQIRPILKYKPSYGYSIYHESFKRFVIDEINDSGASINHLIYYPLITWLEKQSFFESTKSYGYLLKLYYEVDLHEKIANTIAVDFVENSLFHAQPFNSIYRNHRLQKASLSYVNEFAPMVAIAEQTKLIYELENLSGDTLIKYLKAIQKVRGDESMDRVLWDGENLLVDKNEALRFLAQQAYTGEHTVHWSIVNLPSSIPFETLGLVAVKLLHKKQYEKFDELIKNVNEKPKYKSALNIIISEIEWWIINVGDDWVSNTPYFQNILTAYKPTELTMMQAVNSIISSERFVRDSDWEKMIRDLVILTKTATRVEIETAIKSLSNYNWFRNWLIYLIKITELSQRKYSNEDIISAFTFLVRDLDPFKGIPRVSDLYNQLSFVKKSFHKGLLLCNGNENLLISCCELLERVTEVTTGIFGTFSGPLTNEEYLELIAKYLPKNYLHSKYEEYYRPLGSRRVYSNVAEIAFEYASVLSIAGKKEEAEAKYREGVQALIAYGYRKDRTLSEILDCSVPYQKAYKTLSVEWFYELYYMAMTVVTHTDGKSTSRYPIEWFEEFIKVYPTDALKFLVSETLENSEAKWHQESEFYFVLEEYPSLFTPTQWFLLCRSLPMIASDKTITHGLKVIDQIDPDLQEVYKEWLQSRPKTLHSEGLTFSSEVARRFQEQFGISLKTNEEEPTDRIEIDVLTTFPTTSVENALAFLEKNSLAENHAKALLNLVNSTTDWEETKLLLRQAARSFKYKRIIGSWAEHIFKPNTREWLYFNVCLFVFIIDGWYHGLHNIHYIKQAYKVEPTETLLMLREVLAHYLSDNRGTDLVSCNLIKALSELKVPESQVRDLLQTTFQIVKRRLPHPPNYEVNQNIYNGLTEFNRDEIVVSLLIARLKTLTTEKTQGIVWSLTYIAKTKPETIFRPYYWAFSNNAFLLPIHRALLLQILKDYVNQSVIPEELVAQLLKTYPTGFFLEDQFIRSFVNYSVELDKHSAKYILHEASIYDDKYLLYNHLKFITLYNYFYPLTGTFNAYDRKRDEIIKKHESYYMRSEKLLTPITSLANATYEVVNSQFYDRLQELTYYFNPAYTCNLDFFLHEILIQVGSLIRRPLWIPTPEDFPTFEVRDRASLLENEGWILLALKEKGLYGSTFEPKRTINSSLVLTTGTKPKPGGDFYANNLFGCGQYFEEIEEAELDQPISTLIIWDTLEHSNIVYVSPYIVRELDLTVDTDMHTSFKALNDKGEIIIKILTWKEAYYGSIDDSTEVPSLDGVAVMIRTDYYNRLTALYQEDVWFVLGQKIQASSEN